MATVVASVLVFAQGALADPTVHTGPATAIAADSATLNGDTVTPVGGGSISFEVGTSVSYGTSTVAAPVAGGGDVAVSVPITGLVSGTLYHYRLDVTVGAVTTFGNDRTFTAGGVATNAAPSCDAVSLAATAGSAATAAPSCTDADGDLLTFAISGAASHGTASVAGGQLSYTPAGGYAGADSFTYTASDGAATSAAATVTVSVTVTAVAPTIASLLPSAGVAGSTVTVSGTGFLGTTGVTIGGVPATFSVGSDTSITVTVPSGAASGFVAVTNPAGTATSPGPFLVLPSGSFAHVFTVDSTGDGADASPGDGTCDDGAGHCTLRAAIQEANAASGHDLIAFALANSDVQTISPASALPAVTDPVTIDGTTEPGFTSGHPLVEISGSATGTGAVDGLAISAGATTVRGLVIDRFHGWAIHLSGSGGDTVAGNFVGTTPDGMGIAGPSGQASDGILVDGVGNNTIGGTAETTPGSSCAGDCNLISPGYLQAGHGEGIKVMGAGSTGNVIQGNFLGTNRIGQALPSSGAVDGVSLAGASGTTIGGTTAAARNLFGNIAFYGVLIHQSPNTTVEGNWLGIDASGQSSLPITQQTINDDGSSSGVVIGGLTSTPGSAPGNVIGASLNEGLRVAGAGTLVEGNTIGLNAAGTGAVGSPFGISVEGAATIGGSDPGARNVVSGNQNAGIYVVGSNAVVQGNDVGTNPAGTSAVPNSVGIEIGSQYSGAVSGVTVSGNLVSGQALQPGTYLASADGVMIMGGGTNETVTGNRIGVAADGSSPLGNGGAGVNAVSVGLDSAIGGAASSAWNTIAYNGGAGVKGSAVVIGNSIHDNGGLGIDNSVSQANGKITIGHIVPSGGSSIVTGTLNSASANNAYLVQLYVSPSCDPSGFGEGQTPIGTFTLTPSVNGTSPFSETVPVTVAPGQAVAATVTLTNASQGNLETGEFSRCKVTGNADLTLGESVSPAPVDQGSRLTLTYTVTNNGPDPAPGTTLAATFPSNATFAAAKTTVGTCSGVKGSASCAFGTLAPGQTATVTVVLFPVVAGTFPSGGSVASAVDDPAPGDETTSLPITVDAAAFTPANYVVNSTGDGGDSDVSDLVCDDGTGHCTLRAAIEQANLAPGANTISFAIPGSGVQTITPASALPTISDPVTIDGTTQPGYAGQPLVEINGGSTGDGTEGLTINAGDSTVRGLVIDGFRSWAVHLLANGGDTVAGDYIGTTPDGMAVGGSVQHPTAGIFVDGVGGNTIGGTVGTTPGSACAGDCNLISPGYMSGSQEGVRISGAAATGNVVEGNFIGTNRLGQDLGPNISGDVTGILVSGATNTTIGGTTVAARNLFADIAFYGVLVDGATNTTIEGDWFGVDASGENALPITQSAISDGSNSSGTVIGGLTSVPGTGAGNLVGATLNEGIRVQSAGALVEGNLIGTDATGTSAIGSPVGVGVEGPAVVGGSDPRARNVISGNRDNGIYITGSNATIENTSAPTSPAPRLCRTRTASSSAR